MLLGYGRLLCRNSGLAKAADGQQFSLVIATQGERAIAYKSDALSVEMQAVAASHPLPRKFYLFRNVYAV